MLITYIHSHGTRFFIQSGADVDNIDNNRPIARIVGIQVVDKTS